MIHISDLSWTKRYSHPSEFTKKGQSIEVVVLDIDENNRKLSLGHKQIEENPWDTFESTFPIGSTHEGLLIRKEDKGGIVHCSIGKVEFTEEMLVENLRALIAEVIKAKPSSAKGKYLKKISLSSSMGTEFNTLLNVVSG